MAEHSPIDNLAPNIVIRPARETDQARIEELVHMARINPSDLHWERFTVAEADGKIVGIRQVRVHAQGTREVGSGVVLPEYRHQGISAALMDTILAKESGTTYLMCDSMWASYYENFGFVKVSSQTVPSDLRAGFRIGRVITTVMTLFAKHKVRIILMKRERTTG